MVPLRFAVVLLLAAACSPPDWRVIAQSGAESRLPLSKVKLPPGFRIAVYAEVPGARSLTLGAKGTVFVGTRAQNGKVYALRDADRDGRAEEVHVVASGLDTPNGVAFRNGDLYVAEISRVLRLPGIEDRLASPPPPAVVYDQLPTDRHHGWKFIAFGPDGLLYVPIGAPCNICQRADPRYATITRMKPDGTGFEIFARGVRNTVGFDWHPQTRELWFTDNGRDEMGDEVPADELDHAPQPDLHFGYPYCHGTRVPDPEFGRGHPCTQYTPPARELGAHVAAIGMRFYRGSMFPPEYRGRVFIAEHGSWNRSRKIGYRVMQVKLDGNQAVSYEPFAEGWLQGEEDWGRPVDVQELPDGSLLVSDNKAGAVYRITYSK